MAFNKIKNIVTSKKNIAGKNKDSWEWRYFFYDEKLKETIANKIKINSARPIHKQFTDEYIISPSLRHNIKFRKNNNNIVEKLGICGIRKDTSDIVSFRENFNQSSKEIFLAPIKKEITLYNIKKAYSGLGKKIRFEISDINIKNKFVYTVSIKCTSKNVIAEALKKFEIDDFKGTDYISFIKGLTKV